MNKIFTTLILLGLSFSLAQEGEYGFQTNIDVNTQLNAQIGADLDGGITYHTYSFTVPEGISSVTMTATGENGDIDLAFQVGSGISSYDEADFFEETEDTEHSYTLTNAMPNTIYNVEVLNQTAAVINYSLSLSATEGAQAELALASLQDITIGVLSPDHLVKGLLEGTDDPEFSSYHTYIVHVPEGARELIVEMKGQKDLDLAMKFGSDIVGYEAQDEGGDWEHGNFSSKRNATLKVDAPAAGFWYVDVVNSKDNASSYSIEAKVR